MAEGFVKIRSFWSVEQANLAKLFLESQGVDAELEGAEFVATAWIDANAVGGVKLLVRTEHANRAIQLLDSKGGDEESHSFENDADDPSDDVEDQDDRNRTPGTLSRMRSLKKLIIYLFLIPMLAWAMLIIISFLMMLFR